MFLVYFQVYDSKMELAYKSLYAWVPYISVLVVELYNKHFFYTKLFSGSGMYPFLSKFYDTVT